MANFDVPNISFPNQHLSLPSHPMLNLDPPNHPPQQCHNLLSGAVARSHLDITTTITLQQRRSSILTKLLCQCPIARPLRHALSREDQTIFLCDSKAKAGKAPGSTKEEEGSFATQNKYSSWINCACSYHCCHCIIQRWMYKHEKNSSWRHRPTGGKRRTTRSLKRLSMIG